MANLYGVGCQKCNKEVAAALAEMPKMDGYLSTDGYHGRYVGTPYPWPLPYVDGVCKEHTTDTVCGDDGWLICLHADESGRVGLCACNSNELAREVWRGKVEIR